MYAETFDSGKYATTLQIVKNDFKKLKAHLFDSKTPVIKFDTLWNVTQIDESKITNPGSLMSLVGGSTKSRGRAKTASAGKKQIS